MQVRIRAFNKVNTEMPKMKSLKLQPQAGARVDPAIPTGCAAPDMYSDECRGADLTATELLPDGTSRIVKHVVATEPKYDCFYVYPTVALNGVPQSVRTSLA
jgi:hypothetical protein